MKKLILIRHGAAEPENNTISDYDRTLTDIGKSESAKMAAILLTKLPAPQIIITSPAFRALDTAKVFMATFGYNDVFQDPAIYNATADTLLNIVCQLSNDQEIACLVGHNPGISNLVHLLTGKIMTMTTSSWVEIELNVESWAEATADSGMLLNYQYP